MYIDHSISSYRWWNRVTRCSAVDESLGLPVWGDTCFAADISDIRVPLSLGRHSYVFPFLPVTINIFEDILKINEIE